MVPYLVSKFEKQTVSNLVKECFGYDFPNIFNKPQINYIFKYLKDLSASVVLLELDYIDRDFLDDYSRYYAGRFGNDGHKCARLHFFSDDDITHGLINHLLVQGVDSPDLKRVQDSYLGFVVIKPLPRTFIGKACLKLSNASVEDVFFTRKRLSREYNVDLFGLPLKVESIAFQEQDKVISACATTAIWSSLHALKWRDEKSVSSCSKITTNAINHINDSSNSFPSKELSNKQILRALDLEGLRHHSLDFALLREEDADELKSAFFNSVKIHIDSGLPLILGGDVFSIGDSGIQPRGGHAVSVLGYRNSESERTLYVHDDRLGPYARATIVNLSAFGQANSAISWGIAFRNKDDEGAWLDPHEILVPSILIVAADKKVRLPCDFSVTTAKEIVREYEVYQQQMREEKPHDVDAYQLILTFDIQLRNISSIRQDVFKQPPELSYEDAGEIVALTDAERQEWEKGRVSFLTKSFARLQWVADFKVNGVSAFMVLFDATDIPQGDAVSAVYAKNIVLANAVLDVFRAVANSQYVHSENLEGFYSSFLRKLQDKKFSLEEYLDHKFGELRAPQTLRLGEFGADGGVVPNSTLKDPCYEPPGQTIAQLFPELEREDTDHVLWAISQDGALLLGHEVGDQGHPSLTGFKLARIAGEIKKGDDHWILTTKSGRYSGDYADPNIFLDNALRKFRQFFPDDNFEPSYYYPTV